MAVGAGLLLGLAVLLPFLVNTHAIKGKLVKAASQAVEGQVHLDRIRLAILPKPHAIISGIRMTIPESVQGACDELSVSVRLGALLFGRLELAALVLERPDFEFKLPTSSRNAPQKHVSLQKSGDLLQQMKKRLGVLATMIRDGTVVVEDGRIRVQQGTRRADIGALRLKGQFHFSSRHLSLQINRLDLDHPKLSLAGELMVNFSEPVGIQLKVTGQNVDVNDVRTTILSLGGQISDIREVFNIVKGGRVSTITVEVQGKNWADLSDIKHWQMDAEMKDGIISIPEVNLNITDVSGRAVIQNGILTAENIAGNYKKTRARQGSLKIGLLSDVNLFHLDVNLNADVSELPTVLNRVIDDKPFKAELARIKQLTGMAGGKLILGNNLDNISVQIDLSQFNLKARYDRLPYPLAVKGGPFYFKGDEIQADHLSIQMQNTHFTHISGRITWSGEPELDIQTGPGTIVLSEIYPWLKDHADLKKHLKPIETIDGSIVVSALNLKGPLLRSSDWRFNTSGDVQNLAVQTSRLPQLLVLPKGHFKLVPEMLVLSNSQARMLDLQTDFSARVTGSMDGVHQLSINGNGLMGPDFTKWLVNTLKIPAKYHLQPPIDFKGLDVEWHRSGEITVGGCITPLNGPRVMADMRFTPAEIDIRKLKFQDKVSDAEMVVKHRYASNKIDLSFKGNLTKSTLDRLLKKNQLLRGSIDGNLNAEIDLKHPINSVIKGNLETHQVFLPLKGFSPLNIGHAILIGLGNKINVEDADLEWLGNRFKLAGDLALKPETVLLDLNVLAETIDVAKFKMLFEEKKEAPKPTAKKTPNRIQGLINIHTPSLKYGNFTWTSCGAKLEIEGQAVTVTVDQADLCGISMTGSVKYTPKGMWIQIIPNSQEKKIQLGSGCLVGKTATERMEGEFQISGEVMTQGKTKAALLHNLRGDMAARVENGRIHNVGRAGILTNILSFLHINHLVKGNFPDLRREDFRYKSLSVKVHYDKGSAVVDKIFMDAEALNIICTEGRFDIANHTLDLILLLSPLKNVDFVVEHIPVVRMILGGTLVAIPVEVKGDISNPDIKVLPVSAISKDALGIVKRTLHIPVQIIQPILSGKSSFRKKDLPDQ